MSLSPSPSLDVPSHQQALDVVGMSENPSPRVLRALVDHLPVFDDLHSAHEEMGCSATCGQRCDMFPDGSQGHGWVAAVHAELRVTPPSHSRPPPSL